MKRFKCSVSVAVAVSVQLLFQYGSGSFPAAWAESAAVSTSVSVNPQTQLRRLIQEEDTDGDKKITIDDSRKARGARGDGRFELKDTEGKTFVIEGAYPLSNLLQELKLATDRGSKVDSRVAFIDTARIFEKPAARISRMIREVFWDGLTRRIDGEHLKGILSDTKIKGSGLRYLYVPASDSTGFEYFLKVSRVKPQLNLKVVKLPAEVTPDYVAALGSRHGLLSLALRKTDQGMEGVPFVVPGGRFNEMYGWDSYFEALGLIADGRVDLARAMVDNFVYEIRHYGKILNANRTYYLTRSQPPFLTSMIRAVYAEMPHDQASREWLKDSLNAAITEYQTVWMGSDRLTETGLSRYYGRGKGIPPEVEPGHFDPILKPYASKHGLSVREFQKKYDQGTLKEPELDQFFVHDRAVRESGHDTTYRWRTAGRDHCADFVTVDLNSLLYKFELDIARVIQDEFGDKFSFDGKVMKSSEWRERASKRRELILKYLWDPEKKLFFDYDFVARKKSTYVSATTLYPLWAMDEKDSDSRILSSKDAAALAQAALRQLEAPGGVAATSAASLEAFGDSKHLRQWDYPSGWPPHQMMIWQGLRNYGLTKEADRLTYKWLYTITQNAAHYNGTVPEKFDVVKRSHAVFAEYGNVGTQFSYITREGFGWMNASFQVGLKSLPERHRLSLDELVAPEKMKFE